MDQQHPQQKQSLKPVVFIENAWSNRGKKLKILIILGVVLLIGVIGGVYWLQQRKENKSKVPTIIYDGKEYIDDRVNAKDLTDYSTSRTVSVDEQIKELQATILKDGASFSSYIGLAELYVAKGDSARAIENYEEARKIADPNSPYYESTIKAIDAGIKEQEEKQ